MLLAIISCVLAGTLSVGSSVNTLCSVPKVSNGRIGRQVSHYSGKKYFEQVSEKQSFKDGEKLALVCSSWSTDGLSQRTVSNITCRQGKWTPEPNCKPADCAELPNIPFTKLEKSTTSHGSFAIYTFEGRFNLMGNPRVQCLFGEWKDMPNCENVVTCNVPEEIPNGRVTYKSLEYGSELMYTCNEGFKLQTNGTVYCAADGQWSKNKAECIGVICVLKRNSQLVATPNKEYYRSGDQVTFSCPPGQKLSNDVQRVMCMGNSWTNALPHCVEDIFRGK